MNSEERFYQKMTKAFDIIYLTSRGCTSSLKTFLINVFL